MGPRVHEIDLADIVDLIFKVKAGAYLFCEFNAAQRIEFMFWKTPFKQSSRRSGKAQYEISGAKPPRSRRWQPMNIHSGGAGHQSGRVEKIL